MKYYVFLGKMEYPLQVIARVTKGFLLIDECFALMLSCFLCCSVLQTLQAYYPQLLKDFP